MRIGEPMKPNFHDLSHKELALIADRQADKITEQALLIDALKANIREKQDVIDHVAELHERYFGRFNKTKGDAA